MAMAVFRREGRRLLPLLPSIALRPISAVRSPLSSDQKVSNGVGYSTVNGECKFDLAKKEGEKFPPKYQRNKNTSIISKVEKREVHAYLENVYDNVVIVDNVPAAKTVVKKLRDKYNNRVHSCYTKVSGIDVKSETPVDHGELISFSVYCGTKADFGKGKSCIWVDVLGENGMEVFRPYFEDSSIKKVWHNYSVHSHTIRNHGIEISGFHADTLHMARLWDSSRPTEDEYSLEALRSDPKVLSGTYTKEELELVGKISMKTIFSKRKLKTDG